MVSRLQCPVCQSVFRDRWRCTCGSPLDYAEQFLPDSNIPTFEVGGPWDGLWAFEEFLPMDRHASLGEGFTPLVESVDRDIAFKLEYVSPTGSFKDRGASTVLSRAVECGVETVLEDSSGNAGAAIATYAARAGLDADIYVPATVKESKLRAIRRAGATPVQIEGNREDVTNACIAAVDAGAGWYASHAWNPAFLAGTATFAYEIAAQRDWSAPDAVVMPVGHGTLYLGAYRGFTALSACGWIDEMPRLYGAQAAGFAPIASDRTDDSNETNTLADGIQIRNPVRLNQILDAVAETGGKITAIGRDKTEAALKTLHRAGFYIEPTAAVAPAAVTALRASGDIGIDEDVVVALSGSGLKT